MDDVKRLQFSIIRIYIILLSCLIFLSVFICKDADAWVKGYIFSGAISILNFLLLGNSIQKALKMNPRSAMVFIRVNYFVRLLITAAVLFISVKADYINTISVIIGLLLIKYIIFFKNKKEKKIIKNN